MSTKRAGFTLIEMMVVVALMTIMVAIATPRIRNIRDRSNLRAARDEVATAFALARSAAVQKGITATITARGDSLSVVTSTGQRVLPARALKELYGATLSPLLADQTVTFDARGFAVNRVGQVNYVVAVGSAIAKVCVTKLGLVTKVGCIG